jgi:uncharacterized protein YfdQ (DUF2303 family)
MAETTTKPAIATAIPEAQVIAEQARLATEAKLLPPLHFYAIATPGGVELIDLDTDANRRRNGVPPAHKSGRYSFSEPDSFSAYVNLHKQPNRTTLYADCDAGVIEAVFDDHAACGSAIGSAAGEDHSQAGWGAHRAALNLANTTSWKDWLAVSGRPHGQLAFAEFLEDHASDIREPDAALLLEVATTLQASSGAVMKSALRLDNGQVQLRYEETIEAKAGQAGSIKIPTRITLGLSPYEGLDPFKVDARFRYRLNAGSLCFSVLLDRPDQILRAAFSAVLEGISSATDLQILHGTPPEA